MSAKDFLHNAVRTALEKDGWNITHDPLTIEIAGIQLHIDLAAERVLGAERAGQQIAVEVKSFMGRSPVNEFHLALGQILNYRSALREREPQRILYLAISDDIYNEFFTNPFIQNQLREHTIKLLIVNPIREEIVSWKE